MMIIIFKTLKGFEIPSLIKELGFFNLYYSFFIFVLQSLLEVLTMKKFAFTIFLTLLIIAICGCRKVETPTVIGLEIKSYPVQLEYVLGEELDLTGLEVYQLLSDHSKVLFVDYSVSYNPLVLGQNEIKIYYLDFSSSFYINIVEPINIVGLEIKTLPVKLEYFLGDGLDLTGLIVYQVFSDGSKLSLQTMKYLMNP